ncbi:MAG: hypothetical protein ACRC5A_06455, partial [Enterobacteriaceae bacterium]
MPGYQFNGKTFTLWVNDKRSGSATGGASVKGEIVPFEHNLEFSGNKEISGTIGKSGEVSNDIVIHWLAAGRLSDNREQQKVSELLQQRALTAGPNIRLFIDKAESAFVAVADDKKDRYCALQIVSSSPAKERVPLPGFIDLTLSDGSTKRYWHGCRKDEVISLREANWQITEGSNLHKGEVRFKFGFDFNDPISRFRLTAEGKPGGEWTGSATASGVIVAQPVLE